MKKLVIRPILSNVTDRPTFSQLSDLMINVPWNWLGHSNWSELYPYIPQVRFKLGYTQHALILQFDVEEEQLRGHHSEANENVWEDSCVEFFVSFDGCNTYYNIEFNLIGSGLIGYGPADKTLRNRLSSAEIESVQSYSAIERRSGSDKRWSIIEVIPLTVFKFDKISALKGERIHGNFYKCGDHLKNPHFLSWNQIDNATPNFHLPQFFGELIFG